MDFQRPTVDTQGVNSNFNADTFFSEIKDLMPIIVNLLTFKKQFRLSMTSKSNKTFISGLVTSYRENKHITNLFKTRLMMLSKANVPYTKPGYIPMDDLNYLYRNGFTNITKIRIIGPRDTYFLPQMVEYNKREYKKVVKLMLPNVTHLTTGEWFMYYIRYYKVKLPKLTTLHVSSFLDKDKLITTYSVPIFRRGMHAMRNLVTIKITIKSLFILNDETILIAVKSCNSLRLIEIDEPTSRGVGGPFPMLGADIEVYMIELFPYEFKNNKSNQCLCEYLRFLRTVFVLHIFDKSHFESLNKEGLSISDFISEVITRIIPASNLEPTNSITYCGLEKPIVMNFVIREASGVSNSGSHITETILRVRRYFQQRTTPEFLNYLIEQYELGFRFGKNNPRCESEEQCDELVIDSYIESDFKHGGENRDLSVDTRLARITKGANYVHPKVNKTKFTWLDKYVEFNTGELVKVTE